MDVSVQSGLMAGKQNRRVLVVGLFSLSCCVAFGLKCLGPDHRGRGGCCSYAAPEIYNAACICCRQDRNRFQILLPVVLETPTAALLHIPPALCCVFSSFRCTEAL